MALPFRARSRATGRDRHRVVIVGGGFAGLQAALRLRREPVDVTLIDRRNFHLFTPLLYQVATGSLSAGEIATPLRAIFARDEHVRVALAEVTGFDVDARQGLVRRGEGAADAVSYDTLIVAGGSRYSYLGHDEWRAHAPAIKTLDGALDVRRRILRAFEDAELEPDPRRRAALLTFVVVGAGPTGVEVAGQVAEIARDTLRGAFRAIDAGASRVLLVDPGDRVLSAFPPSLSAKARGALRELGVTPVLGSAVVDVDADGVVIRTDGSARRRIDAGTVVWAAGVTGSPLAADLARQTGAELDGAGRVTVDADLTLPGHPEILALGDMVRVRGVDGRPHVYPGVSAVAMQQGRHAARVVSGRLRGRAARPFRYRDKGDAATIGRAHAVVDLRVLRLSGRLGWWFWLALHLYYLIGFQNRVIVLIRWAYGYVTRGRGARLILGGDPPAEPAGPGPGPGSARWPAARPAVELPRRLAA